MKTIFGHMPDGTPVHAVELRSKAGAKATIIEWGAVVRDLIVPGNAGGSQRVVLGLNTLDIIARIRRILEPLLDVLPIGSTVAPFFSMARNISYRSIRPAGTLCMGAAPALGLACGAGIFCITMTTA